MTTSLQTQVGLRVKALRRAAGMSQEAFADHSGFARSYISRVERGTANLALSAIEKLAASLGVEAAEFFVKAESTAASPSTSSTSASPKSTVPASRPAPKKAEPPVMVPFAKDGSCFHPGLIAPRVKTYCVGAKGARKYFATFRDALKYLNEMKPVAQWSRPNKKGEPGVVTEVKWAPLPAEFANPHR